MNIVMVTNNYTPLINGVARSVASLTNELRRRGHRVLVLAPQCDEAGQKELDTIRLPAIQHFNGTDFSVSVPLGSDYLNQLDEFRPEIVHSHHPFLLGTTALRIATRYAVPLVFTHHTLYEHYSHYIPGGFHALRHFVTELTVGYCNLCDAVMAPSPSVAGILRSRDVDSLLAVVPTGIDLERFRKADRLAGRQRWNLPEDTIVVGHVGRLAAEKNVRWLAAGVGEFLKQDRRARFLIVGQGPELQAMQASLTALRVADRVQFTGVLEEDDLANAYAAMDVFAFASRTETQGIVLLEAMATGVPIVALDAPGARDVVRDGNNGRLLATQSRDSFAGALQQITSADSESAARWREAARATAEGFSIGKCAEQTIAVYRQVCQTSPRRRQAGLSRWEQARQRIEVEMQLWANRARAVGAMLTDGRHPSRVPGLRHVVKWWRLFRHWISRREWSVRILKLPTSQAAADESGLVLLQIDGLSRSELERALEHGRMPFLRGLLERESYRIETMYSGQPSTTPAVLGEVFYGMEQSVPSFAFRDHRSGQVVQMFQPTIAAQVQSELAQQGEGLIAEGSVYCVCYSGGAADSSFCPATTGWRNLEEAGLWQRLALVLMNVMSCVRILLLSIAEFFMAVWDCARGIRHGLEVLQEVMYVPRRVMVNIMLRELTSIGAEVDVTRGVPVLHANFLGYDENAHRRGPASLFAHYTLRGIDHALRRIWNAAHASHRRNYHVWIMSDHGQERTVPYSHEFGRPITEAVQAIYGTTHATPREKQDRDSIERTGVQWQRSRWLRRSKSHVDSAPIVKTPTDQTEPLTVAIGPLGHVYWPTPLDAELFDEIAQRLVSEAGIPLVLAAVEDDVWAWTNRGRFSMPDQATEVLAPNHPHLHNVARDLTQLCAHPDAGDFVISGWRNDRLPLSFVTENGGHGGPGPRETSAFLMLPADAPRPAGQAQAIRPGTLRRMAQTVLRRGSLSLPARSTEGHSLRIVTYNVHSCIGLDGRLSPARIARVLAATAPDVIALQELDVSRGRSGLVDQAQQIAKALEMELHFHPSFQIEEERYGNAVLSRLPMKLVQAGPLPHDGRVREPRGALWVEIEVSKMRLQFMTTHLGTSPGERVAQMEHLLSPKWLDHPECHGPVILCGDFNALPGSRPYRQVNSRLRDAQLILERHRPRRTWFAPLPLTRIDHVFVNDHLEVKRIDVPRTQLSRFASDHLPLVVDVEIIPGAALTNPLGTKPGASSQELDRTPDDDRLDI